MDVETLRLLPFQITKIPRCQWLKFPRVGVLFGAAGSNVRRKSFAHKSQLEPPKIRTDCVLNIISKTGQIPVYI
jgi:hypothetical protein